MIFREWQSAWCCALLAAALAGGEALPAADGLSRRLMEDAEDGRLDQFELISAALVAGGVEGERELAAWSALYRLQRNDALKTVRGEQGGALAIHRALHERLLAGGYRAEASDLRHALAEGDYNCLSALAIYVDLCEQAGEKCEIWLKRGHVFAVLGDGEQRAILEPGNPVPAWRELPEPVRGERRLNTIELLGKFYYNRGVARLEQGEFAAGLAMLEASSQLDPHDADARSNLAAGLNNWAVTMFREQDFAGAASLIERGLAIDAGFAPLLVNQQLVRAKLGR